MLQLWLCGITQRPEEVGRKVLKPLRAELKSLDFTQLIVGSRYPSPVWEVGTLLQSYIDPRVTVKFNLFFCIEHHFFHSHVLDVNLVFSL